MFFAPIDFTRIDSAFAWPEGWVEIALTGFAIGLGWALDRRLRAHARRVHPERAARMVGVGFPLFALVLLACARWVYQREYGEPFLLDIAVPLMAALAIIRALIYGLRRLFPATDWLQPWERLIGGAVWITLLLYYLGVLPDVIDTLDAIEIPLGKTQISVLSVLSAIAVVLGSLIVTLWISGFIERRLDKATRLDSNLRAALSRFIRAVLLVVGGALALRAVGFDLTLLTVFSGAVGVGIGLGLQKLASNYIAGFTILLDRSIRLGDTITVEGRWMGTVTNVSARYVLVRRLDGVEVIVPNETLVTTTVLNHSHAAPQIRVATQFPLARDSDVEKALALLAEAALTDPRVIRDAPFAPAAFVAGFTDSGVSIELGVFVTDPLIDQLNLRSAIHRAALRTFAANGIAVSYPHREIHVLSSPEAAETRARPAPGAAETPALPLQGPPADGISEKPGLA
jgi:small-conductance mechanosensitive channel